MHCRRCGHKNEPGFQFCENCGLKLVREKSEARQDELHIPSIFEEPVEYRGKYSETPAPSPKFELRLPSIRLNRKVVGILVSMGLLLFVWVFASQYGRSNEEIPPVIQEYADAVRAQDVEKLQSILLSSTTLQAPNPNSYEGFLRIMEIPGRLNESVRNLEVDLSHLLQDENYVSNLPVKLLLMEAEGKKEYRIGVETFDINVGTTGASIDGHTADADGIFHDYLLGQYTMEYGLNTYPLQLDSTSPQLQDGMIIPAQLAELVEESPAAVSENTGEMTGSIEIVIQTDANNGRIRVNGEDINRTAGQEPIRLNPGDRLQIVEFWQGGVGMSDEISVTQSATYDFPIHYDTEEFRQLIYDRIRTMLIEDALMMEERNPDGFTTVVDEALENAVDVIHKLINGNQYYAGTYDRIGFDPESFHLQKETDATVHVIGELRYVYQTHTVGTPKPDIDSLWREDKVMFFDLVLDTESGQWMVSNWGPSAEEMSGAIPVEMEILQ